MESSLEDLLGDVTTLIELTANKLKENTQQALVMRGIDTEFLQSIFSSSMVKDPFCGLQTEFLQNNFFKENFNLVVDEQCKIPPTKSQIIITNRIIWRNCQRLQVRMVSRWRSILCVLSSGMSKK